MTDAQVSGPDSLSLFSWSIYVRSIHIQNGGSCEVVQSNGVTTNGHGHHHHHHSSGSSSKHKSSSKDKHRDKEREHKSSSSSSSSKEHKSSSRDKDRHKSSSSSSSKHRDKDKERDGSSHRSSSSSSHRDKDGSSSSKHKSSSSSGHHKSSSKDKERRDKDKDRSSSSSSRHKSSSSSSRDKERSSSSHKSSSSSSSKSKHSSSRHSSSSSSSKDPPSYDGVFVKPEPVSQPLMHSGPVDPFQMQQLGGYEAATAANFNGNGNDGGLNYKNGYEESIVDIKKEDESFNNLSQASSCDYSMSQFRADEPPFEVKHEQSYVEEDSTMNYNDQEDETEAMDDDEEDVPLAMRKRKQEAPDRGDGGMDDDDDDIPLLARKKVKKEKIKKESKEKSKKRVKEEPSDDYGSAKPKKKKMKKEPEVVSPTKRQKTKVKEEEEEVWRWWEEEKRADGVKWSTLEHKGPVFAPRYERVPRNVRFYYDGKPLELSEETEEAATFYAKMLNHDYCTKEVFNNNFFKDFRKSMTNKEKEIIKDFRKCGFQEMFNFFQAESEKRKAATKEEKLIKKNENEALMKEFGFCMIDGHKEKIGNFRLEPPGLFRGRGEHPKMGMIKRRIQASDVSINCGKESKVPSPPPGSRWKEVRHDNTVTWLASWIENVQGQVKYIMLNPSSKLKGEKDHIKYETARRLDKVIDKIRATYRDEWKSKEMRVRQRAVALYFIDKLALRAGNEKDEDQADTVGCCSLRVEHVQLHKELNGKENVVVFDFPGKDSIRYYNEVEVEKRVFKNLELFMEHKKDGDDLFDRLNTQVLNEHLKELMEGLTAKVFRTYNASKTLQSQLDLLTDPSATVPEKLLAYNRANRAVAILCNHQRSVPKSHEKSMENLKEKIKAKREAIKKCEAEYHSRDEKKGKQLERLKDQLKKLELQETDRDENKTIALGTSKLNYLDPRISVAWCKKNDVPIEKIFNKTQRTKFLWAVHMADENYRF
ncbi:DNA topoisomerase 1 isoform X1 [Drosophila teissieri]|uniref:DNA topoisomerase 1 isoform X1 n=1 Tax=Drosophila teissieri TaxID=7243 RepID=UPI001CBA5623|nr:DNA topoisomerase 1 isoform X1 [Drosophila teissieri]